ncbi:MAG: thioesterase family protein [Caldiserica bacterium]|jgi:predicted thioesterase|nr:thioesterase family protein [Caldisericota bacterium]
MKKIEPGISAELQIEVSKETLASQWGSGIVEVFSTPAMIGLMEGAAEKAVRPYLDEGETTVGTWVSVKHLAATPLGMKVRAVAVLQAVEGRRLSFKVEAWDEVERIGEGEHERFVVDRERFTQKAKEKRKQAC